MAASVNILVRCEDCALADRYGRDCKKGLLNPVFVLMSGESCKDFKPKTTEQIKEQLNENKLYHSH